ncbi:MAG: DNA polymerase I [Pirellulaceae bacterium]|nr:DNA polymerase I [Pirellulaceae bacterium]
MTTPESDQKKLVLLDAMALIYRAHFALIRSPRFTSRGQCTSAVFGVANTILDLIARQQPSHLAAAFDTPEPTARHIAFPEYKAHRDQMPEDLVSQLPWIDRLLEAFNIPILRIPGYEADDIIGTLAHQAAELGFHALMVTPDKDYDQLVRPNIQIYKPGRQGGTAEVFGPAEVLAKWEIQDIQQVIDILGLMGDSSDNIPGVPGIGPKTATKLIQQFGSLESLLDHADQLKGKQRESLKTYAQQARLSKQLVTIQLDVPHSFKFEEFVWQRYDTTKLKQLFQELEFESLSKRLFGEADSAATPPGFLPLLAVEPTVRETADDVYRQQTANLETQSSGVCQSMGKNIYSLGANYHVVQSKQQRAELLDKLLAAHQFCFDCETTGLDPRSARPLGIAFALQPHEAFYVVCPDETQEARRVLQQLLPALQAPQITKIGHNLKYDLTLLKWHGFELRGPTFDTMLAHMMLEPDGEHGMDHLALRYLDYHTIKIDQLIGPKGAEQRSMADVPLDQLAPYACEDADITLQLAEILRPRMDSEGISRVCYEVEFPLTSVLVDMEHEGIRLDSHALREFSAVLESEITKLQQRIFEMAGHAFNIDSPRQLGAVLYDELHIDGAPKKTATGQYSTRESELERLSGRHAIVKEILEYRNATKLKRTYVDQLPAYVNPRTGRLHTVYGQAWTATGRMQSTEPNLQTIPIRKQRGREIRAAFVPRNENYLILSADYSQIELRIMAELSGDQAMLEAFQQDVDIHAMTAAKVHNVPLGLVTREMRAQAKMVNFGIIYGISAFGLQQRLNIPKSEAAQLIRAYFEEYPQVKGYIESTIEFARQHGYVQTLTGRRRNIRDINSRSRTAAQAAERLAMNSPIQGTAADILKLAMIAVHRELQQGEFQTKMLLTVHDEIVFDMHRQEIDCVIPVIKQAMSTALPLKVPLVVETGYGPNWLAAH